MNTSSFKKWDIYLGWFCFSIALLIYSLTVEPTNSFWDCGEYITAAAKLEVAHPPGAPLLQMIGAFFSMFALHPEQIAVMVNYVSVVSSAFTILFLFWTLTNLTKKLVGGNKKKLPQSKAVAILGSGLIGAMTFTFSDSFWFNAVETEVYSTASLVMAVLLWLGLKWIDTIEDPRSHRWLILISFIVGLTFGVQFMGFLAIPSITLLYFFKRFKKLTLKKFLISNAIAVVLLMAIYKFSLTYVLKLFGWSEVFFVNEMGLPFNTGSLLMGLLFLMVFVMSLRYTWKRNYKTANTTILCILFLVLGFSSWLMLPIRANANVVINENNPSDARALLAYYNREQYPSTDSPFYGSYYSDGFASAGESIDEKPKYEKDTILGKYKIVNAYKDALRGPNPKHQGWFPRMWSDQNAENYIQFFGALKFKIKRSYRGNKEVVSRVNQFRNQYNNGEIDAAGYVSFLKDFERYIEVIPPTLGENLKFMFQFQFNYMYWRYFMWNFVGRQNDIQGRYDGNGEWLSGILFIDNLRLETQENLPSDVLQNKGRNTYFFLPLILGLIGIFFQILKNPKQFWVLFVFFLFTGIAIQFYTNPTIFQPRERDYSLVGSFYIFSLWIGLGVYGLSCSLQKWLQPKILSPAVILICLLAVPGLMAFQNWDDHDRSNKYTANSMAKAYLDGTQEDVGAILFTTGDNDTFPLWYVQEIEGYRTDVRIMVTTYSNTDWYIDQMKRKAYESDPIPSQLTHDAYKWGTRDAIYYQPLTDRRWSIQDFMKWVASDEPQTKIRSLLEKNGASLEGYSESDLEMVFYPTNKIRVPVNKKNVVELGLVKEKDTSLIVDYMDIDLPTTGIGKNSIIMLDILANNDWERPLYFSGGSFDDSEYLWLKDYLQLDALVYKLIPIKTAYSGALSMGRIDNDLMYDIVNKWEWGNGGDPTIYHDPQTRKQAGVSLRLSLARLLESLLAAGEIRKAARIIELAMTHIPVEHYGYYAFVEPFLDGYFKVGESEKGNQLFQKLKKVYQEQLNYYAHMPLDEQYHKIEIIIGEMEGYSRIIDILAHNDVHALAEKETLIFNEYLDQFQHFFKQDQN